MILMLLIKLKLDEPQAKWISLPTTWRVPPWRGGRSDPVTFQLPVEGRARDAEERRGPLAVAVRRLDRRQDLLALAGLERERRLTGPRHGEEDATELRVGLDRVEPDRAGAREEREPLQRVL